jgi:prepilin-type N-terminal cleavage/methylation domain-containing protein/prepilin-type processing-associated H-X9-DG protein
MHRGLTLTELLVVMAILTLLAVLLLPVVTRARARARQARCASQLHQIARAGLVYLADYDDRFPSLFRHPRRAYALDLPTLLQPYLRDGQLQYCPERQTVRAECVDLQGRFGAPNRCMGYGYNWGSGIGWLGSGGKRDGLVLPGPELGHAVGVTLAEVAAPSHCLFLGDTNDRDLLSLWREAMPGVRAADSRFATGPGGEALNARGDPYEPARHGGGNQFAFVDGHVQWLPFPGGQYEDGGPWVVPDMSIYSRTGGWETGRLP